MSYLEDTIDFQAIEYIDAWLDSSVSAMYKDQPLAQDWARISKVAEEVGEAIQAFIGATGQNPRKGITNGHNEVMEELADVVLTGILAMQHFSKNSSTVRQVIRERVRRTDARARMAIKGAI